MGVILQQEEDNVRVLRVEGILRKSEFDAVIKPEAEQWGPQTRVRLLVLAEGFQGWERSEEWGDISFILQYGDRIDRIAIVADQKWETELLIFAAAGLRRAPVKFFPLRQIGSARAWLREKG
ncbi:MAG: hypothetical protein A4E62_02599 [Syntrophorhabdus sp. PtaU1.Bin002]|nr:MAG: hypothetical protein A4E62_02599 [Syntrophorhabdus sp. PtaU1.Bin002]